MDASGRMSKKKRPESGIETKRDGAHFRAGVVGSNPAGPTISEKIHALSIKIILK
jgi:acid stress-induced BolA-like protein IbaG/YrbA